MRIMTVCAKCQEEMFPKRNGILVKLGVHDGLFHADLWECRKCGIEIIRGFGMNPIPMAELKPDYIIP